MYTPILYTRTCAITYARTRARMHERTHIRRCGRTHVLIIIDVVVVSACI